MPFENILRNLSEALGAFLKGCQGRQRFSHPTLGHVSAPCRTIDAWKGQFAPGGVFAGRFPSFLESRLDVQEIIDDLEGNSNPTPVGSQGRATI